ncbi:MAG: GHKL domain-containing protein [Clostridia bacterium]|nr:GHKL domain-containing protein [Clostridia bacterium]
MIGRLKRRFILLSTVSLLVLMTVVVAGMNIINYNALVADIDEILVFLSQNRGTFPDFFDEPEKDETPEELIGNAGLRLPGHMSPELPYESRYFSVLLSLEGEVLFTDISRIASVDGELAAEYATEVLSRERSVGFADTYRYIRQREGDTVRITFLDCGRKLEPFYTFLYTSIFIALTGLITVFLVLVFFSGRIVRPMAESYEKQKRFITDAGHEIKTPLTIIRANTDILEMELGQNESLSDIRQQTERLTALTNDLVYLARMEEAERSVPLIEFPLSEVVEEEAEAFHGVAKAEGKTLQRRIQPMLTIKGNDASIRRLVSLLMDNALKYSPDGSTILLRLCKQGNSILLEISNETRSPLRAEQLNHVFDRFYRADTSRSSDTGGYGIGLSTARAITNAHGGKISANIKNGRVFTVAAIFPAL